MAVDPVTDTVYAVSNTPREVSVIDGATNSVTTTIALAGIPAGIAVNPATDTIYVLEGSNAIAVISGATDSVTRTIPAAGVNPTGIAVDSVTDRIYVAYGLNEAVTVIDGATNTVTTTINTGSAPEPYDLAVDETTNVIWAGNSSGVIAIDGATNSIATTTSLGSGSSASAIAVDPATDLVYATDGSGVAVIDGATAKVTATIAASSGPFGLAVDPASDTIYATNYVSPFGSTQIIDGITNAVTDTLSRGGVGIAVDRATGTVYEAAFGNMDGAWVITPAAVNAWSPVITNSSSDVTFRTGQAGSVAIMTAGALPADTTITETGALPKGMTLSPAGILAGTPGDLAGGLYPITVSASNGVGSAFSRSFQLIVLEYPIFTSAASATFQAGVQSSFAVRATGYPVPDVITTGDKLPPGVQLVDTASGWELTGTPAAGSGGAYPITLIADQDSAQGQGLQDFTLTVRQAPRFTSRPRATFQAGQYTAVGVATSGYPAPKISARGKLPDGVKLASDGLLSGAPSAHSGGIYRLTITASNGVPPAATQAYTLTVDGAPSFRSVRHVVFKAGSRHSFTIATTGFPVARLSERGSLPKDIRFMARRNGTAILTGTAPGADKRRTYVVIVTASNEFGTARERFRLTIS